MKHSLIILISYLLLSSPVIGEETGVLYLWENGTKYMGEWKDGKKHGQGTFTYGKGKWEGDKYEGEFKDGYRNGQGTYTWSVGDKYVGNSKMINQMVKEHTLGLMEESMKGNLRMG